MRRYNYARLAVLALLTALLSACATLQQAVKEPEVTVQDLKLTAASLSGVELDFILGVENPNPLGIKLSGLSYRLDVQGQKLLAGSSKQKLKVAANGSSRVSLPLSLDYRELQGGIEALLGQKNIAYALSGELDFGLFRVPYSKRGSLAVPSLPRLQVERLAIERVTLSGLDLVVALKLSNDNDFRIALDGIDYGLKLADTTVVSGRSLGALTLEPGGSDQLALALSLDYRKLGGLIQALQSRREIPLALDGRLQLPGAGTVPLSWHGDVAIAR